MNQCCSAAFGSAYCQPALLDEAQIMSPPAQLWIAEKFSLVSSQVETTEDPELFGETSHLTEKTELVDGVFPSWRKVMPSKRRTQVETFPCLNGE
ncbi:hypothetical protein TX23_01145 [Pseudomonas paralactis]|uniref:Uncharacterized protein n=1 Tax=Pseudomonas paralactis TaxID=1615673 RepID=A0A0R3APG8_9PSED|nr:hypothetical protein TX23_01145 [Pseudomonas paralactis]